MTPTTVFVVVGATGEYGDGWQWEVAVLRSKDDADRFARVAGALTREKYQEWTRLLFEESPVEDGRLNDDDAWGTVLDPQADCRYQPPRYFVNEVPFVDLVPEEVK